MAGRIEADGANGSQDRMGVREWMALLGLTFSAFIFNTSEFIPIGLLTDIGSTFSIGEAQTGVMITVYAWAVTILSLPLMLLTSKVELKRLLLGVVAVFALGQAISVVAPTFTVLVAARLCVACAHSVFWAIAAPIAVRVVPASSKALALSMVATGTSVAMILGLPLGRVIGLALGWRMTFLSVAVAAAVVLVYLFALLPKLPVERPFTVSQLPTLLKNRMLVGVYLMVLLIATGYYVGYSYIEPFLLKVAGLGDSEVTMALTVFGAFGIVGSLLFARLYDGRRSPFVVAAVLGMVAALGLLLPVSGSLPAVVATCALWGLAATDFNLALQAEELACVSEEASAVAMSIYSGTFNLGIGLGTALGGVVTDGVGLPYIGFVGAAIVLVAELYCVVRFAPMMRADS